MEKILELHEDLKISRGSNRTCYQHPYSENLCVKVLHPSSPRKTRDREFRYFKSLHRRKVRLDHVADLVGVVETNQGNGVVFELVRDFDGTISKTLDHYLKQDNPFYNSLIVTKIEELKRYLYREAIIFRDLITLNIVLQRVDKREFKPVVVDGIGHNDFIPLCNFSIAMSRKKIVRTWNRKKNKWFDHYAGIRDFVLAY